MKYITFKRFRKIAMCGEVNLAYGTECEAINNIIFYQKAPICFVNSQNAHDFFAQNSDGNGILRGKLTQSIMKSLADRNPRTNKCYKEKWCKVWSDKICQKYKRNDYDDYWLWNHDFYNAPIEDLQYIATLVSAKET